MYAAVQHICIQKHEILLHPCTHALAVPLFRQLPQCNLHLCHSISMHVICAALQAETDLGHHLYQLRLSQQSGPACINLL